MHEDLARIIADLEQTTTVAAAAMLDAQVDLAVARHALVNLKRRIAAAEILGPEDVRVAKAELARAYLQLTEVANLLISGATTLTSVVSDMNAKEPPPPTNP